MRHRISSARCLASLVLVLALLLLSLATPASARHRRYRYGYPAALIDRPMTLPVLMFQPSIETGLTNDNEGGQGESLSAALDVGVAPRLQVGALFAFPLHPVGNFGDFLADLQVNLAPDVLNLRLDAGAERIVNTDASVLRDAFLFGFGLPLRARLHWAVALVSGSNWTRGFNTSPLYPIRQSTFGSYGTYGGSVLTSTDLFTLQVYPNQGFGGTTVSGALFLPLGLLIQPHPVVAFGFSTGYRLAFSESQTPGILQTSATVLSHFVPLRFDLIFNIAGVLDIGFTALILGEVASNLNVVVGPLVGGGALNVSYAQVQKYDFWIAAHF